MFTTEEIQNIGEYKLTFLLFIHIKLSYGLRHMEKILLQSFGSVVLFFFFLIVCF